MVLLLLLFQGGPSVTSVFALLSGRRFLDANLEARSAGGILRFVKTEVNLWSQIRKNNNKRD